MASSSAVAVWRPIVQVPTAIPVPVVASVRLTRRGRALRAVLVVVLLAGLAALGAERLTARPALAGTEIAAVPTAASVVVEEGDSLWRIARRVAPGSDPRDVVESIRSLNGLRTNMIQPGQVLLVPSPRA
jgi:LysM repeat protein